MIFRRALKEISILLGISVALALIVNTISPRGIALVGQWDLAKGVIAANPYAAEEKKLEEVDSANWAKDLFEIIELCSQKKAHNAS